MTPGQRFAWRRHRGRRLLLAAAGAWFVGRPVSAARVRVRRRGDRGARGRSDCRAASRGATGVDARQYRPASSGAEAVLLEAPQNAEAQRIRDAARRARCRRRVGARLASPENGETSDAIKAAGEALALAPDNADARRILEQAGARTSGPDAETARRRMTEGRAAAEAAGARTTRRVRVQQGVASAARMRIAWSKRNASPMPRRATTRRAACTTAPKSRRGPSRPRWRPRRPAGAPAATPAVRAVCCQLPTRPRLHQRPRPGGPAAGAAGRAAARRRRRQPRSARRRLPTPGAGTRRRSAASRGGAHQRIHRPLQRGTRIAQLRAVEASLAVAERRRGDRNAPGISDTPHA